MITIECMRCGNKDHRHDDESPYLDEDGDEICSDCHHELYEFTCAWCQEYADADDQHVMLVIFERTNRVAPGVYRIGDRPYYYDGMIESGLYENALAWVSPLPSSCMQNCYPCGHLCPECVQKITVIEAMMNGAA
jgi:hypothetical protein